MARTLRPSAPDPELERLQKLLQLLGYGEDVLVTGFSSASTWSAVELFQLQHVGPDGEQLSADRVVGDRTWWALENPSGSRQRSGFPLIEVPGLTLGRAQMLELLRAEYEKDVHEDPDGSNRSPEIDGYWGSTGLLGKAWCCAFVSTMLRRALGRYPLDRHWVGVQKMARAAEALGMITRHPRPLDVFIQLKDSGKGHTGFASAFDRAGNFATFEGNCGNRLKNGRRRAQNVDLWIDVFQDGQPPIFQELDPGSELVAAAGTR